MNKPVEILSTKILDAQTLMLAEGKGFHVTTKSFIDIRSALTEEKKQNIRQLFNQQITTLWTSANAVRQVFGLLDNSMKKPVLDWRVYCINGATRSALLSYITEEKIIGCAENAAGLSELIKANPPKNMVFFSGKIRRLVLPDALNQVCPDWKEMVVYDTVETPSKTETEWDGILFFSPSGVRSFFSINKVNHKAVLVAIGKTTAAALKRACNQQQSVLVADTPSPLAMFKIAENFFKRNGVNVG